MEESGIFLHGNDCRTRAMSRCIDSYENDKLYKEGGRVSNNFGKFVIDMSSRVMKEIEKSIYLIVKTDNDSFVGCVKQIYDIANFIKRKGVVISYIVSDGCIDVRIRRVVNNEYPRLVKTNALMKYEDDGLADQIRRILETRYPFFHNSISQFRSEKYMSLMEKLNKLHVHPGHTVLIEATIYSGGIGEWVIGDFTGDH